MNYIAGERLNLFSDMSHEEFLRLLDEAGFTYREIDGPGYIEYEDGTRETSFTMPSSPNPIKTHISDQCYGAESESVAFAA